MSRIPFIHTVFPDLKLSKPAIMARLTRHKRTLIAAREGLEKPVDEDGAVDEFRWRKLLDEIELPWPDRKKIEARADAIKRRHETQNGLGHLKSAEREKLELLREGVELAAIPTEHRADELAAALHAEFPWMGPATEVVWRAMRRSAKSGEPGLRLPPLLLDGPSGIGKSHWARHLGTMLSVPTMVFEATTENASFGLVGSQRGWGNATPGRLINTILQHRIGNPVVVVDEVEKSGRATSTTGRAFSLPESLLPLLEPVSARAWSCPFYEVKFDMGWVIWVLTSNSSSSLPQPLLSRCPPIRLRALTLDELIAFALRQGARRDLSEVSIDAIVQALLGAARPEQLSLRTVLRMIERASSLEGGEWHLH